MSNEPIPQDFPSTGVTSAQAQPPHKNKGFLRACIDGFRRLMPREDQFVVLFSAHAAHCAEAALLFRAMLRDPVSARERFTELCAVEKAADAVGRDTIRAARSVLIAPFDRSDILTLTNALDDVVDFMKASGKAILRYKADITPEMLHMADCICSACEELAGGMGLLSNVEANADKLNHMCRRISTLESQADRACEAGLDAVFEGDCSPGHKLMVEKVYECIEEVIDRCEDIADEVEAIVLDRM